MAKKPNKTIHKAKKIFAAPTRVADMSKINARAEEQNALMERRRKAASEERTALGIVALCFAILFFVFSMINSDKEAKLLEAQIGAANIQTSAMEATGEENMGGPSFNKGLAVLKEVQLERAKKEEAAKLSKSEMIMASRMPYTPNSPVVKSDKYDGYVAKVVDSTAYVYNLFEGNGITATGRRCTPITETVRTGRPYSVAVAQNPRLRAFPLGTRVIIDGIPGEGIVDDTGSAVVGIDIAFGSEDAAIQFGRRNVKVHYKAA